MALALCIVINYRTGVLFWPMFGTLPFLYQSELLCFLCFMKSSKLLKVFHGPCFYLSLMLRIIFIAVFCMFSFPAVDLVSPFFHIVRDMRSWA